MGAKEAKDRYKAWKSDPIFRDLYLGLNGYKSINMKALDLLIALVERIQEEP
jgi:hypothetical protein